MLNTKLKIFICALFLAIQPLNLALSAPQTLLLSVPFQYINLSPSASIQANYNIGTHGIIFCFMSDSFTTSVIQWPYNGHVKSGTLPIYLKNNPIFSGEFADPSGSIVITNNTGTTVQVNCLFAY
jgi:hypothetical protein